MIVYMLLQQVQELREHLGDPDFSSEVPEQAPQVQF